MYIFSFFCGECMRFFVYGSEWRERLSILIIMKTSNWQIPYQVRNDCLDVILSDSEISLARFVWDSSPVGSEWLFWFVWDSSSVGSEWQFGFAWDSSPVGSEWQFGFVWDSLPVGSEWLFGFVWDSSPVGSEWRIGVLDCFALFLMIGWGCIKYLRFNCDCLIYNQQKIKNTYIRGGGGGI